MTNNEIFSKSVMLNAIPTTKEGKELDAKAFAHLMLMRVHYNKAVEAIESDLAEVLKGMKKEGFDERAMKANNLREDKDKELTAEDKAFLEEYDKEYADLNEKYLEARKAKFEETNDVFKDKKMSEDDYTNIIELLGSQGTVKLNGRDIPTAQFLYFIADSFVN